MNGRIQRDEPQGARLPLLGKIKIGEKRKNSSGKEFPGSVDYFIAAGKYEGLFKQAYGDAPNKIQIVFISDNWADVCNEHYELRDKAGRLLADGDGANWRAYNSQKDCYNYNVISTLPEMEKKYGFEAKVVLTLRFILPAIPGVFGQWQFTTKGVKSSIPQIRDTFDQVQTMAGTIINIPFDMTVEKVQSQKPGSASVFPVVSLIPNLSTQNLELLADFVQSGQRIRGMLTEQKIQELCSLAKFQLAEHIEEAENVIIDDQTGEVSIAEVRENDETPEERTVQTSMARAEEHPKDTGNKPGFLTQSQKEEIWTLAKKNFFTSGIFKSYLISQGFQAFDNAEIPEEWMEKFVEDIKSGRALELAGIVDEHGTPGVVNV
jgi:hypothetical protein